MIAIRESCLTIVIVSISIPKVKNAVFKNLLIFSEKYLPQSVRLLEGRVEMLFGRMPFEHAVSLHGASLISYRKLFSELMSFAGAAASVALHSKLVCLWGLNMVCPLNPPQSLCVP